MDFSPAYRLLKEGDMAAKVEDLEAVLNDCILCPRQCHVNRNEGETGYCRTGSLPFVSSWGPHFGEEKPLVGTHGSGTIFFGNCNLGCLYCQNYTISQLGEGNEMSHEELAGIMLSLQREGCHNINLVTPSHQVAAIARSILIAAGKGLSLPIVYNCGGYESLETLRALEGMIDIYMPDMKYADGDVAELYSHAGDYPEVSQRAVMEMHRQVGDLTVNLYGIALRGLLVRHLVLPQGLAGTDLIVNFIATEVSLNTYLHIMDQYHPCYKAFGHPPLDRRISAREYREALDYAIRAGIQRIDGMTA